MTEQAGAAGQTPTSSTAPRGAPARPSGRDAADAMARVGGSKGWAVAYGVLAVIAGLLAVAWPGKTAVVLAVLFAVQLFVLGVFRIVEAFAVPDTSTGTKVVGVLVGILAIIAGVLCLRSPVATAVFLALVVGAFWLVNGILEIVAGIAGRGEESRVWSILGGVLGVIAGIIVLSMPGISVLTLAWVLGILLIVHGVVVIVSALSRRSRATAS
jgi:uncharacterized membrane protein HdeD (DUF308 family)